MEALGVGGTAVQGKFAGLLSCVTSGIDAASIRPMKSEHPMENCTTNCSFTEG